MDPQTFQSLAAKHHLDLRPTGVETLQLNITKLCNQACLHCHVDASPRRREAMPTEVLDRCLAVLRDHPGIKTLDVTGGAPELHPEFRRLVGAARALGKHVMVRHNLTVTLDPHPVTKQNMEDLPEFFREHGVEVISSLPYYQEFFTDKQRGSGVFKKSIESMRRLNALGYGVEGSGLQFNLVYNPVGAFLPAAQQSLEADYKRELEAKFGLVFNRLYAITNMPIHRFKAQLVKTGNYEAYMEKLASSFNSQAAAGIMCRTLISVSYDGKLYDCDFNQMLGMTIDGTIGPLTVFDYDESVLLARQIRFAPHCLGCTAGAGSSCGGTTT